MLLNLFRSFLKIGTFAIGGGYAMLPLVRETVLKKERWVSEEKFFELMTLAQGAPGIFAVNLSILIGFELAGLRGALAAMAGAVLPAFASVTLIAAVLTRYLNQPTVNAFFQGAIPAVAGIIAATVWQMGKEGIRSLAGLLFGLLALILIVGLRVNPILVIFLSLILVLAHVKFIRQH